MVFESFPCPSQQRRRCDAFDLEHAEVHCEAENQTCVEVRQT